MQRNAYAGANVQFACRIFCISGSANVTAAKLPCGAQLFLRYIPSVTQATQRIAHAPIPPDLLFHTHSPLLTSIGCSFLYCVVE